MLLEPNKRHSFKEPVEEVLLPILVLPLGRNRLDQQLRLVLVRLFRLAFHDRLALLRLLLRGLAKLLGLFCLVMLFFLVGGLAGLQVCEVRAPGCCRGLSEHIHVHLRCRLLRVLYGLVAVLGEGVWRRSFYLKLRHMGVICLLFCRLWLFESVFLLEELWLWS